jgi:two-component system sensor histidine kinase VicK
MNILPEHLFKTVFELSSAPSIILKADAPFYTIVAQNQLHKVATYTEGKDLIGKGAFEIFKPNAQTGEKDFSLLQAKIAEAAATATTIKLSDYRYDIIHDTGSFSETWWNLEIIPITDSNREVSYLMLTTYNITESFVNREVVSKAKKQQEALYREQALSDQLANLNEELERSETKLATLNFELESRVNLRTQQFLAAQAEAENQRDRLHRFFMQAPAGICVLDGPDLVFELINPSYQQLFSARDLLGKPLLEALPEINGQPIWDVLQNVYRTGQTFEGNELLVPLARHDGAPIEERYFNFIYQARHNAQGQIDGILAFVFEVTELVSIKSRIQKSENSLRNLVMTARYALMILHGPDFVIEIANQPIADLWQKTLPEITGRTLMQVLPELEGQPFPALLKQVYETGNPYGQEEEVLYLTTPEGTVKRYISFYYDPMLDSTGQVAGIIVTADDITETVQNKILLQRSYENQQALNEQLANTNEELAAANEELTTGNEELASVQESLSKTVVDLAESEARFRNMVEQAPIGIAVITGHELVLEVANQVILGMWNKPKSIVGQTLAAGIPELQGQPFLGLLETVLNTGQAYYGNEAKTIINYNGQLVDGYFNFVYQPITDENGDTISIMVVANEVTEQVKARQLLEQAQDTLKLALSAAELGTFDLDLTAGTMYWDERCRTLFGISHDNTVSYEEDFLNGLHADDRERIAHIINNVFIKSVSNGEYDVEYRTVGVEDQKLRWVRAKGKTYFNDKDEPQRFTGAVLDITEQKQNELRKNDFIGMVSHELKTPLTSLNAYIQMLHARALKSGDQFTAGALDKAILQMKKMTSMINGFLNVSRLESGKIHLTKQRFELNTLLKEVIDEATLTVSSHHINFIAHDVITMEADRDKIGSVISNLLSNAVKYSPKGKTIEVQCRVIDNMAQVSVNDEGMGIKPQDIEKLFERYYRVNSKHTQTISGFGIGLYLSAEIIERHHGKIWVESETGVGSTFYFTLPIG